MTHGMSEDEPVKLDDIPASFIQEALYDNFRPVQPLNSRTVYSSFKIEPSKSRMFLGSKVFVLEYTYCKTYIYKICTHREKLLNPKSGLT